MLGTPRGLAPGTPGAHHRPDGQLVDVSIPVNWSTPKLRSLPVNWFTDWPLVNWSRHHPAVTASVNWSTVNWSGPGCYVLHLPPPSPLLVNWLTINPGQLVHAHFKSTGPRVLPHSRSIIIDQVHHPVNWSRPHSIPWSTGSSPSLAVGQLVRAPTLLLSQLVDQLAPGPHSLTVQVPRPVNWSSKFRVRPKNRPRATHF